MGRTLPRFWGRNHVWRAFGRLFVFGGIAEAVDVASKLSKGLGGWLLAGAVGGGLALYLIARK